MTRVQVAGGDSATTITVPEFLGMAATRAVVWGEWDCHAWLAEWVMRRRGCPDPAATLRRRYSTARGALRLLKREGGSEALVSRLAAAAGLERIEPAEPGSGAIGLVPIASGGGFELIGALCTGPRWAVLRRGGGVMAYPFLASCAWRV